MKYFPWMNGASEKIPSQFKYAFLVKKIHDVADAQNFIKTQNNVIVFMMMQKWGRHTIQPKQNNQRNFIIAKFFFSFSLRTHFNTAVYTPVNLNRPVFLILEEKL